MSTNDARRFAVRFTARGVLALVAVVAFGAVLALVRTRWSPLHTLDLDLDARLNRYFSRHSAATSAAKVVTVVGQPVSFEVLAVVGAVALWRSRRRRLGIFVVVTVLGAGLLGTIVKLLVHRARPTVDVALSIAKGSSFPSGHALTSAVSMGVLVVVTRALGWAYRRAIVVAAAVIAALVAFSRLALGVHYLSDVVGAWLLAVAWLLVMIAAFRLTVEEDRVRPVPRR